MESNTHARLRARRTGGQTHGHTQQWPSRTDTERAGVCLGSAGCLLVNGGLERSAQQGCKVGEGGSPFRSVQREAGRVPGAASELPGGEAGEALEGLHVCARWEVWGDTSSLGGWGLPEEQRAKASEKFSGPGARAPGWAWKRTFQERGGAGEGGGVTAEKRSSRDLHMQQTLKDLKIDK